MAGIMGAFMASLGWRGPSLWTLVFAVSFRRLCTTILDSGMKIFMLHCFANSTSVTVTNIRIFRL